MILLQDTKKNEVIIRECFWYSANIQYCAKVMQRIIVFYRDNREISAMFERYFRRNDLSAIYRRAIVLTTARYRRYIVEPLMNYRFPWAIYRFSWVIYRLNSAIHRFFLNDISFELNDISFELNDISFELSDIPSLPLIRKLLCLFLGVSITYLRKP